MDSISRIFQLVRVRGTAYVTKSLDREWGIEVAEQEGLCRFHMVMHGCSWVVVPESQRKAELRAGDIALIPHGRAHLLSDHLDRAATECEQIPQLNESDRGPLSMTVEENKGSVLLCGYFRYAQGTPLSLITQLPDLLVLRSSEGPQSATVEPIARVMAYELQNYSAGSVFLLDRLAEVLFMQAIRDWAAQAVLAGGKMQALSDERIQRALASIHDQPNNAWTVESLAEVAGQSRTAFAIHFREATGFSPIEYLGRWRIELTKRHLVETTMRLTEIAQRTGFSDANSLTRAFKRLTGLSPSDYRRSDRESF